MTKKLLYVLVVAALAAVTAITYALPATAAQRSFRVRLSDGSIITVTVDAACGSLPSLPGHVVSEIPGACSTPALPTQPSAPASPTNIIKPPSNGGGGNSGSDKGGSGGSQQSSGGGGSKGNKGGSKGSNGNNSNSGGGSANPQGRGQASGRGTGNSNKPSKKNPSTPNATPPTHQANGVPTPSNPTFFNALPGPAPLNGVPNFVIEKFKVPIFLLPIYQAAGIQYSIRWEVLAAINEIETDYGRNLNVSSAGAVGWMQFMPATWKTYGVDANGDGKRDPYNPVDAIFAAARYLKAAGGDKDIRRAVFAYNHAGWYVDSVMLRARLIAGYPPDFVGSLTGLTEGRFPVDAKAKYADDAAAQAAQARIKAGQNASRVISSNANRRGIDIFSQKGAPVIAVNDGIIKKIGNSSSLGRYIVLQDVYGNQYTYSHLGSIQQSYPVPKQDLQANARAAKAITARQNQKDPTPKLAASGGSQSLSATPQPAVPKGQRAKNKTAKKQAAAPAPITYKARLFAHPQRPDSRAAGGLDQIFNSQPSQSNNGAVTTYDNYFAGKVGLNSSNSKLQRLKQGATVIGGTVLGHIGKTDKTKAPFVYFQIRPAGKGAPQIDPKPILDGWKLLESTAIYRANGKNALYGNSSSFSIGQVLLMPKALLEKRVLSDARITIYPAGRNDIKTGQIDRRVLATLEYLAESGLDPTVSALKSGHSDKTSSGNISEHSTGDAVDIAKVNGIPILGHQDKGGIAEQTVRRLMMLQGTMAPHQIISLLDFGANTLSLPDHADHVHVGFRPLFGSNAKLGAQTAAILKPGQWDNLVKRLNTLPNPVVPTKTSKYALPAKGH